MWINYYTTTTTAASAATAAAATTTAVKRPADAWTDHPANQIYIHVYKYITFLKVYM